MTTPEAPSLTPRERQVSELIAAGQSNKGAAYMLGISPRTVEVHRARAMEKLGARNTADLVRISLALSDQNRTHGSSPRGAAL